MTFRSSLVLTFFLLLWPGKGQGQDPVIIYDGYTGIYTVSIQNDTARIGILIKGSPAEKAGVKFRDQIIAINDSSISGDALNQRMIHDLLYDKSGEAVKLDLKRRGVDSLLHFSFKREPYLYQIVAFDYEYLVDSLDVYDISEIATGTLDSLFKSPYITRSLVHSVEEGSPADTIGILPGDLIVSLQEEMNNEYYFNIGSPATSFVYADTTLIIRRGDSLIHYDLEHSLSTSLRGINSQFEHDFSTTGAWLRVKTRNRISEDRIYVVNLPEMGGTDSAGFFVRSPSGTLVEKRSGLLIPVQERDFVYKDWHAATIPLEKDGKETFFIRWNSESGIGAPLMHFYAHETMVQHDRVERMVLFSLLGMMLIISCFFLILFFALRDRQYIYFSLYILFFAIFLFISEGYLEEYHWRASLFKSIFISGYQAFTLSLVTLFFLLFGISYLELKQKMRGWYLSVMILIGLISASVLIMLLDSLFRVQLEGVFEGVVIMTWAVAVAGIPLFILVLPNVIRIREGFKPGWYFLIANLVLIPLAIITLRSTLLALTPINVNETVLSRILEVSSVYLATILQILIFSIGLAQKMKLNERERKIAQERIIDQLKENEKLKDKVNRELEQKVQERTREIREQKEEIESQRDEIIAQRDEIEAQRDLVFAQKKEITDSIGYAQRIQTAILPHNSYLDRIIPEYFVLYKPRDIVSGDFYWIREIGSSLVVVVADCTGHGVPGAFLSMLGITLLNELFVEGRENTPAEILGLLRSKVKALLVQEGNIRDQKDGMDMAIAVIDKEKKELQFAGAYNPLYMIRQGDRLIELKGDRQPIGIHWEETEFKNHVVKLRKNDTFYVFSDGFVDQYGGKQKKKFMVKKFKDLLLSVQAESMERQKQHLEKAFEEWRGNLEQIDDVCVVGVRV